MIVLQYLKRIPITLLLTSVALLLHTVGELQPWCELHFQSMSWSDVHRVFACHWLHWSTEHLAWDLGVFAVLGAACELRSLRSFAWTVLPSAALIPLSVMWLLPQVESYRGLSGIDTALFGLLVMTLLIDRVRESDGTGAMFFGLFLAALFGKISLEIATRANIFVNDESFTPIPLSHLVGAAIGVTAGLLTTQTRRFAVNDNRRRLIGVIDTYG
jgi:hypothetical protein